jgi:quercetin dioxygenase-like cupin family protein
MKKLIGGAAFFAGLVVAATALATSGSGITSSNLAVGRFGEINVITVDKGFRSQIRTKGESDLYIVSNRIAPGGHTGWHTHPGPSLITVKSGRIWAYEGDDPTCTAKVYEAGDGFVDPGGGHVHLLRNEGTTDVETIAAQLLPADAVRRIDAPSPGNCPF